MHGRVFKVKKDTRATAYTRPQGEWIAREYIIPAGTPVKVVMVSRFGDCGITTDLKAENGYDSRVQPEELEIG